MVTDPELAAEALRHRSLDKTLPEQFGSRALDEVSSCTPAHQLEPHS